VRAVSDGNEVVNMAGADGIVSGVSTENEIIKYRVKRAGRNGMTKSYLPGRGIAGLR